MALTPFQRDICTLIAQSRIDSGESYLAGGAALNELLPAPRLSRDIDLFHDTNAALNVSFAADRALLGSAGYSVRVLRERPSFVECEVERSGEVVLVQWVRDSAYRFFPLVAHAEFGLVLHPFDLATNKLLALIGRTEVRDWIDVIECDARLQPLGFLAWAACGKDPGFSPASILEHAARSSRYSAVEVASLSFAGGASPDAGELSRRWHDILRRANQTVAALPAVESGKCVIDRQGHLIQLGPSQLPAALASEDIAFHAGSIRGALPQLVA